MIQTGGLNLIARAQKIAVGKPTAARIVRAVLAHSGLRPDGIGVELFGGGDDSGEFVHRPIGIDEVELLRSATDFAADYLAGDEFIRGVIFGTGTAAHNHLEAGLGEGVGNVAAWPIDDEDGMRRVQNVARVHLGCERTPAGRESQPYIAGRISLAS